MAEWKLYPAVVDHFEERGFRVASQVTDPGGSRWEIDAVAFTPELDDVRVVEVKQQASPGLIDQCVDRLRLASRVYAAVPAGEADALRALIEDADPPADALGALAVDVRGVRVLREPEPTDERREEGPARVLERVLRATLVEG